MPLVVFSQVAGTSLWFATNAVLVAVPGASSNAANISFLTSLVQAGFIAGTALFALLTVADRFKATSLFFVSCLAAAAANLLIIPWAADHTVLALLRFATGFFLAGIYPVGMKIAADLFPQRLGAALGYLVGALVLGTALPHLFRTLLQSWPWQWVLASLSLLALLGGIFMLWLGTYYNRPKSISQFKPAIAISLFRLRSFRSAAFGYFGHMWELYAFWAFVPFAIQVYNRLHGTSLPIGLTSFGIIAVGSLGCVAGGILSQKQGSGKVAKFSLLLSGTCCLLSPFSFTLPAPLFIFFFAVWGCSVVADSPQFSTLIAQAVPLSNRGTALTVSTSIGFVLTILSIQLLQTLASSWGSYIFWTLVPGPVLGLLALAQRPGEQKSA